MTSFPACTSRARIAGRTRDVGILATPPSLDLFLCTSNGIGTLLDPGIDLAGGQVAIASYCLLGDRYLSFACMYI